MIELDEHDLVLLANAIAEQIHLDEGVNFNLFCAYDNIICEAMEALGYHYCPILGAWEK